jgi:hypothetical protein
MKTQRNIYDEGRAVSPGVSETKGTWFLGRDTTSECAEGLKGSGPHGRKASGAGTWFLGRKARHA